MKELNLQKHLEKAMAFVRKNRSWGEAEEEMALHRVNVLRCSIMYASPVISSSIRDLMNEYGEDNNLPDEWWDEWTEDDIFFKL